MKLSNNQRWLASLDQIPLLKKSRYLTRGALKWISKNNSMRTILAMSNRIYCRLMRFVAEERWCCCNRYTHDSEIIFKSSPLSVLESDMGAKIRIVATSGKAEFWGIEIILSAITILLFVSEHIRTNERIVIVERMISIPQNSAFPEVATIFIFAPMSLITYKDKHMTKKQYFKLSLSRFYYAHHRHYLEWTKKSVSSLYLAYENAITSGQGGGSKSSKTCACTILVPSFMKSLSQLLIAYLFWKCISLTYPFSICSKSRSLSCTHKATVKSRQYFLLIFQC